MAADLIPNQDARMSVSFERDNAPVTGGTLTATTYDQATGLIIDTGPADEDPARPGLYTRVLSASIMVHTLARIKVVFLGAAGDTDLYHEAFYSVGAPIESAQTRRSIRNGAIEQIWGSHTLWKLEFGTSVSNTTRLGYVPALAVGGDGEYRGRWLRFYDGNNAGLTRRVTSWNSTTRMLGWEPATPDPALDGARVDLLPIDPDFADQLLNDAIVSLGPGVFDLAEEDTLLTDGATILFPLPADAVAVYQVGLSYVDQNGLALWSGWLMPDDWRLVPGGMLELLSMNNWDGGPLGAVLSGYGAWPPGYRVKVRYLIEYDLPLTDADLISIDPTYLRYSLGHALTTFNREQERLTNYLAQQAELWRPRATRSRPPNCKAVPR